MKVDQYADGWRIETYFGRELPDLSKDKLLEVANCYIEVYNQSWGESWTTDSALREIRSSFHYDKKRMPLASLVYYRDKMVGFAWGLILSSPDDLIFEKDMPFSLNSKKKREGVEVSKYWLKEVVKQHTFFLYRELGVVKEHRGRMSSFVTCSSYQKAYEEGCKVLLLWTSTKCRLFALGLGVRWSPIHFFLENDLCIMAGDVAYTKKILEGIVNGNASDDSYRIVLDNICQYTYNK